MDARMQASWAMTGWTQERIQACPHPKLRELHENI